MSVEVQEGRAGARASGRVEGAGRLAALVRDVRLLLVEHWLESRTRGSPRSDVGGDYPFVENRRAPFTPARRALPMMNLALITSAGAYIDGTAPFDTSSANGDLSFREIPIEVEQSHLRFAARGYNAS